MTKTLPKLGKAFDQALVSGRFNIPMGFHTSSKNASNPAFMQVYFNLVFDEHGFLLDVVPIEVVKHIRQVLYFAYKLEMPYSNADNSHVIENFVSTDESLALQCDPLASRLLQLAKIITEKVFYGFDHKDIRPRHGPGAVATGEKFDTKWKFSRLYNSIHQVYPYYNYYVVGGARELTDRLEWYRSLQRLESGCAKVVLVPKDSRGPRLISCEPLEYQWIQQGLGRELALHLERHSPYTKGHVNFTHQEINGAIALASSASGRYATIDLKDASDRVSVELVRRVFERSPRLLRALEALRSTETKLPDGRVITLNKYAPMGSALCFPVESYIFWVIIVSAVITAKRLPLNRVVGRVFVYGDDIVIPTEWALPCIQALETLDLIVNVDKSCFSGSFRESCGVEAFRGSDVTPFRLRKLWSNKCTDGSALMSYTHLANDMVQRGYNASGDFLWSEIERTYGKIPFGTSSASFPCRVIQSPSLAEYLNGKLFRTRWNGRFQCQEFLLPILSFRRKKTGLDGWTRLLRNLIAPPVGDPSTIVLPLSMKVKRGWARVT